MRTRVAAGTVAVILAVAGVSCAPSGPDAVTAPDEQGLFTVTLEWDAPSHDAEGHPLDDLEGYRVYHGSEAPLTRENGTMVEVGSETRHRIEGLEPGRHHFAVTAVDSRGNESDFSEVLSVWLGNL